MDSIIDDLRNDDKREVKTVGEDFCISSKVNYPNNKVLVKQKVYIDKNGKIKKVEVVDKEDKVQIRMTFDNIKYNKKFDDNYFKLNRLLNKSNSSGSISNSGTDNNSSGSVSNSGTDNNSSGSVSNSGTDNNSSGSMNNSSGTDNNSSGSVSSDEDIKTKKTATIKDVLYPMYLPGNTYLTNQESIDTINGKRMILTFGGDSSFVLVEETASYSDDAMVIPVSGEFDFLSDVIGVIDNNSITWQTGGIEYYLTSDTIKTSELLDIARSISVLPVSK